MRVAVIGAGIVGVTSAYELALAGHEVRVFERRSGLAAEASFAHAGLVSAACLSPWTTPASPWPLVGPLTGPFASRRGGLRLCGPDAASHLQWLWRWWRARHRAPPAALALAVHRLAQFSQQRLDELTRVLQLEYGLQPGLLLLLRQERDLQRLKPALARWKELGLPHEIVDGDGSRRIEPGLHRGTPLHAAVHLPQDSVGNCRQFAHLLKAQAQQLGARYSFGDPVRAIRPGLRPEVDSSSGSGQRFDAVVICAGAQAQALLPPLGLRLRLAAVHGYTVTAPLRQLDDTADAGPRAAVMDAARQVAISRIGQRIRVAGGSELGGTPGRLRVAALSTLYRVLDDWFPGAMILSQAQAWKGARPVLAEGRPVLGESGAPGVWLNLGHGACGWTLACGSARLLAERISGRPAPLDLEGLSRLGSG